LTHGSPPVFPSRGSHTDAAVRGHGERTASVCRRTATCRSAERAGFGMYYGKSITSRRIEGNRLHRHRAHFLLWHLPGLHRDTSSQWYRLLGRKRTCNTDGARQAEGAPAWLRELDCQVEALANTHRWIHGDPAMEVFQPFLYSDRHGPKPGFTALMRASADGTSPKFRKNLRPGPIPTPRMAAVGRPSYMPRWR
jgi:hypothetical protein